MASKSKIFQSWRIRLQCLREAFKEALHCMVRGRGLLHLAWIKGHVKRGMKEVAWGKIQFEVTHKHIDVEHVTEYTLDGGKYMFLLW